MLRAIPFAFLALSSLHAQRWFDGPPPISELRTNADGSTLVFTSLFGRTGQSDEPHQKIIAWDLSSRSFRLLVQRPYDQWVERGLDCSSPFRVQAPSLSADGRSLAFTGFPDFNARRGCTPQNTQSVIRLASGAPERSFEGLIRLSANARYAVRLQSPGAGLRSSAEWIDLSANRTVDLGFVGALPAIASNGAALFRSTLGLVFWENGIPRPLRTPSSCLAPLLNAAGTHAFCSSPLPNFGNLELISVIDVAANTESILSFGRSPSPSDDASTVLFLAPSINRTEAFLIRKTRGGLIQLTQSEGIREAVLSGNGLIAYAVTESNRLLRIDTSTARSEEILPTRAFLETPVLREPFVFAPGQRVTFGGSGFPGPLRLEVGGRPAPVVEIGPFPNRLSAMISFDVPNGETTLQVRDTPSPLEQPPVPVRIVPSRPVFFPPPFPPDRFEAYLANSAQLATRETPAPAGSVVTAYFTGLGRVSPEVPAGDPAPASPLAQLIDPPAATLVLFCGATTSELPVSLEFAGLAPRLIGLYQLNFRLPGAYPPTCLDSRGLFIGLLLVGDPVPDSPNGPFVFIRP